jgi:hypothetical protein
MKGSIWLYVKEKEANNYRFQIDGLKHGLYTKTIDPIFKGWEQVGSGVNYKNSTETLILSKSFASDEEMIMWVKDSIKFPTTYSKCNAKCTVKVLVEDTSEELNEPPKITKQKKRKTTS